MNKWVCIVRIWEEDQHSYQGKFTCGKIYEGELISNETRIRVKDDDGRDRTPNPFGFIPLDEWRQIQIDNILS